MTAPDRPGHEAASGLRHPHRANGGVSEGPEGVPEVETFGHGGSVFGGCGGLLRTFLDRSVLG
jgi:hypothetical protein